MNSSFEVPSSREAAEPTAESNSNGAIAAAKEIDARFEADEGEVSPIFKPGANEADYRKDFGDIFRRYGANPMEVESRLREPTARPAVRAWIEDRPRQQEIES